MRPKPAWKELGLTGKSSPLSRWCWLHVDVAHAAAAVVAQEPRTFPGHPDYRGLHDPLSLLA